MWQMLALKVDRTMPIVLSSQQCIEQPAQLTLATSLVACCLTAAALAAALLRLSVQVQRGSLFPAACISLYTMYLAYSAMQVGGGV